MEIGDWIARDSPANAVKMVEQLEEACTRLLTFPRRWPAVGKHGARRAPEGSYVIIHRVTTDVEILRIVNAARDCPHLLAP